MTSFDDLVEAGDPALRRARTVHDWIKGIGNGG